jgi:hypothetical protein
MFLLAFGDGDKFQSETFNGSSSESMSEDFIGKPYALKQITSIMAS